MSRSQKTVAAGLWGLVVVALGAVLWFRVVAPGLSEDLADTFGRGDYELVTADGSSFTEDTLTGAPSAVFFGFTHCPEVCPTTLGDIAGWMDALAEDGGETLRAFFVTIDPERDTPEVLGEYVSWAPNVTAVSGSREEIDKAIKAFRVYARKVPLEGGDYTMDHSTAVLLFDEDGRLFEPIGYGEEFDRAMDKIRRMF